MIGGGAVAGYHIHQAKEQKVTKEEWQAAYKDWVGKWSDDTRFELFDMNGDDVPEIVRVGSCMADGATVATCTPESGKKRSTGSGCGIFRAAMYWTTMTEIWVFFMTAFLKSKMGNGYRSAMANVEWKIIRIRSMMKTETMFSGINGMEKKSQIRNMKRN